jgi:hypothetical protein
LIGGDLCRRKQQQRRKTQATKTTVKAVDSFEGSRGANADEFEPGTNAEITTTSVKMTQ